MIDAFTHLDLSCTDPIADMEARMAGAGIDYALAVETWNGDNLPWLRQMMENRPTQFRVVLCFRRKQRESFPDLLRHPMVLGVRAKTADMPHLQEAATALEKHRKWLMPHGENGIGALSKALLHLVERTPDLQVYLPHLGWPMQDKVVDPEWDGAVCGLRQILHLVVGISAIPHFSRQPFPHADVKPFADRLREMFEPDSMVAASDYPLMEKARYADYMHLAEQWIGRTSPGAVPNFERVFHSELTAAQPRKRGIEIA